MTQRGTRNNLIGLDPTEKNVFRFSNEKQVNAETPPAFIVHSSDDNVVPVLNSIEYYKALVKNKVPAEYHIFQKGGHGYGLAAGKGTESAWPDLCLNWLKKYGFTN